MPDIQLYDATLRDGMQGPGLTLSAAEKVRVARKLDELGVHLIEAGFPSSNPKELELFELLAEERFEHADVAAFGMTRRRGVPAAEDDGLRVLAACFAPVCTIVGKTWALHLEKVVRVDRAENLAMIAESVAFLAQAGSGLDAVVKTTEFVTPAALGAYRGTAEIRRQIFAPPYPAATAGPPGR